MTGARVNAGPTEGLGHDPATMDLSEAVADNGSRKPLMWSVFGALFGLGLLYAATRKVQLSALRETLDSVDEVWLLGILALTFAFVALKAWRWGMLLRFLPGTKFSELHSAVYVGLAANFLVSHMGEFVRTMIIARRRDASASAVFASVLVERALDFIALLVLLALAGLLTPDLPDITKVAAVLTGALVMAAIAGLHLLLRPPTWLARVAAKAARPLPVAAQTWLRTQLSRSRQGLASIRDPRRMMIAISVSVLQWSLIVLAIWSSGLAVGQAVSLTAAIVTFVLIVFGLTLPNAPMQIGTTQLAFAIGFGIDRTGATSAVAASIIYTAFLIIPVMVLGAACLVRGRMAGQTDRARPS